MGIVLGFGVVEERVREQVKRRIVDGLSNGLTVHATLADWNKKNIEYDTRYEP